MKPIRFYLLALIVLVADQVTKWSIVKSLSLYESRPAIGNWLMLTYTRNTGGAFSIFPAGNRTFVIVAALAVPLLLMAYHRQNPKHLLVSTALSLALGGAIGNLTDRIRFGYVVDFFDFHGWSNRTLWPIFNIADSAITVGIIALALHLLFAKTPAKEPAEPSKNAPDDPQPETAA